MGFMFHYVYRVISFVFNILLPFEFITSRLRPEGVDVESRQHPAVARPSPWQHETDPSSVTSTLCLCSCACHNTIIKEIQLLKETVTRLIIVQKEETDLDLAQQQTTQISTPQISTPCTVPSLSTPQQAIPHSSTIDTPDKSYADCLKEPFCSVKPTKMTEKNMEQTNDVTTSGSQDAPSPQAPKTQAPKTQNPDHARNKSPSASKSHSKLLFLHDSICKNVNKTSIDKSSPTSTITRNTYTISSIKPVIDNICQAPDIVLLHTGINDLKVSDPVKCAKLYTREIINIKNKFHEAHIIISSVAPVRDHKLEKKREIFNSHVKSSLRSEQNISFISYDSISVTTSKFISSDNIHPTSIGVSVITRNIIDHIASLQIKKISLVSPPPPKTRRTLLPTPPHRFRCPRYFLPPPPRTPGFVSSFLPHPSPPPPPRFFHPPIPSHLSIYPPLPPFPRWPFHPSRQYRPPVTNFWRDHIEDY
jgi:hypothetical protein